MRVVDTSAWLEWLTDSALGRAVGAELPSLDQWIVPTVVQYELTRALSRKISEDAADQALAFSMRCVVAPLDTRLAVKAAEAAQRHALAMADAVIYATAIELGADLLTCDAHFERLPRVAYFAKSGR
jgi:predicted nucleic acid-binding protein